jgi:hypothetical protein
MMSGGEEKTFTTAPGDDVIDDVIGAGRPVGARLSLSSLWSMPLSLHVVVSENSDSESMSALRSLICITQKTSEYII